LSSIRLKGADVAEEIKPKDVVLYWFWKNWAFVSSVEFDDLEPAKEPNETQSIEFEAN